MMHFFSFTITFLVAHFFSFEQYGIKITTKITFSHTMKTPPVLFAAAHLQFRGVAVFA